MNDEHRMTMNSGIGTLLYGIAAGLLLVLVQGDATAKPLERIRVSDDGRYFVGDKSGNRFVVWGVNYDHDQAGRLLDEYWLDEWSTVVEDFGEIKALGANCVRIHLQVGKFMDGPDAANAAALAQLTKLLALAE